MDNWIFTTQQLQDTPSRRDGISCELEAKYRKKTAWFIEELAKEMKCDRLVVSTALVLFHRFYAFQSLKQHNRFIISVTCLFLASKAEESPKKLRDMVAAYFNLRIKFNKPQPTETEYKDMLNKLLLAERILMQTLCFDLQLIHPYKICLDKIKDKLKFYIPADSRQAFHQNALNFLNDSYRTTLCLQYSPTHIALGAIYLASLQMNIIPVNQLKSRSNITSETSWFDLLIPEIDEEILKSICTQIMDVIEEDVYIEKIPYSNVRNIKNENINGTNIISNVNSSSNSNNYDRNTSNIQNNENKDTNQIIITTEIKEEGRSNTSNNNNNNNSSNNGSSSSGSNNNSNSNSYNYNINCSTSQNSIQNAFLEISNQKYENINNLNNTNNTSNINNSSNNNNQSLYVINDENHLEDGLIRTKKSRFE